MLVNRFGKTFAMVFHPLDPRKNSCCSGPPLHHNHALPTPHGSKEEASPSKFDDDGSFCFDNDVGSNSKRCYNCASGHSCVLMYICSPIPILPDPSLPCSIFSSPDELKQIAGVTIGTMKNPENSAKIKGFIKSKWSAALKALELREQESRAETAVVDLGDDDEDDEVPTGRRRTGFIPSTGMISTFLNPLSYHQPPATRHIHKYQSNYHPQSTSNQATTQSHKMEEYPSEDIVDYSDAEMEDAAAPACASAIKHSHGASRCLPHGLR
ncbi:hypothetical protein V8F33_004584 [Rhypophila sp. PSN 637]